VSCHFAVRSRSLQREPRSCQGQISRLNATASPVAACIIDNVGLALLSNVRDRPSLLGQMVRDDRTVASGRVSLGAQ